MAVGNGSLVASLVHMYHQSKSGPSSGRSFLNYHSKGAAEKRRGTAENHVEMWRCKGAVPHSVMGEGARTWDLRFKPKKMT